jgi:antitoxin (DNA-binding transcriptional repressor) of toxin-antitoxin stability system
MAMKSVNVAELKNKLSSYLQLVRKGEEIIVRDRDLPIARISPCKIETVSEADRRLIASGLMKPPAHGPINWKKFSSMPGPDLSENMARRAILEEREEGR